MILRPNHVRTQRPRQCLLYSFHFKNTSVSVYFVKTDKTRKELMVDENNDRVMIKCYCKITEL